MTTSAAELHELPMLDAGTLDFDGARRVTFLLHQRFHYAYDGPVRDLDHRLMAIPRRQHGSARRRVHHVQVSAPHAQTTLGRDRSGNVTARIQVADVPDTVRFDVTAVVDRVGPMTDARLSKTAPHDPRLLRPTRRTEADEAIRTAAHSLATKDHLETAERLCAYVHDTITYEYGVTSVSTTAAQALAGGRGVCQDSAHLMLALCHVLGIPARYVSGHLLGEGGTHAWTEVILADGDAARAVALDPCNGRPAGAGHLTVAVGRDYGDVAPTSGTYDGEASGRLTATKRVGVTAIE